MYIKGASKKLLSLHFTMKHLILIALLCSYVVVADPSADDEEYDKFNAIFQEIFGIRIEDLADEFEGADDRSETDIDQEIQRGEQLMEDALIKMYGSNAKIVLAEKILNAFKNRGQVSDRDDIGQELAELPMEGSDPEDGMMELLDGEEQTLDGLRRAFGVSSNVKLAEAIRNIGNQLLERKRQRQEESA